MVVGWCNSRGAWVGLTLEGSQAREAKLCLGRIALR